MRGSEQHVERKIRLWVVQQEHNRLREVRPERPVAPRHEGDDQRGGDLLPQAHERWRLG